MRPDIKKYVFHLCWSPESVPADVVRFFLPFNTKQSVLNKMWNFMISYHIRAFFSSDRGFLLFVKIAGHRRTDELLGQ